MDLINLPLISRSGLGEHIASMGRKNNAEIYAEEMPPLKWEP